MAERKPRLLVVTERFFPEEFIINELVSEFKKRFDVTVLTQNPSYPFGQAFEGYGNPLVSVRREDGVRVIRGFSILGYKRSLILKIANYFWFALYLSFVGLLLARRVDRIFIYHTGPLTLAVPAITVRKVSRARTVIWTQDIWPDTVFAYGFRRQGVAARMLGRFVRWVYSRCDEALVSCESVVERVRAFAPRLTVGYAPNWAVRMAGSPRETCRDDGVFTFMFAGNVGKVQNLGKMLAAYAIVERSASRTVFEIVGDGSEYESLRSTARNLGLKTVVFRGRVPQAEMPSHYGRANALVLSLNKDPIFALTVPYKFQSYLAAGKPILAAMEGEVPKIVQREHLGLVADPDDIEGIAEAMKTLVGTSAEEFGALRARADMLLEGVFNKASVVDRILEAID